MISPPEIADEPERLQTLREYRILDTLPEETYDRLARLAAEICQTPIALVSLIDKNRQWFKSSIGLDASETTRDVSFCAHAIAAGSPLVVDNATTDPRFTDNPLVTGEPNIRFYAGEPLRAYNGKYLGTLCVIDTVPRTLSTDQYEAFAILAREVETHLELHRIQNQNEELMKMIVHDIRSPLYVVTGSTRMILNREKLPERTQQMLSTVLQESERIYRMTSDLMDVYSTKNSTMPVVPVTTNLVTLFNDYHNATESRAEENNRHHQLSIELPARPCLLDQSLLRRILDNLADNAIKYSPSNGTIRTEVGYSNGMLSVSISDEGPGIPQEKHDQIFELYYRLERDATRPGLGLGLAFCKIASAALGGNLFVGNGESDKGTTFRLEIPVLFP